MPFIPLPMWRNQTVTTYVPLRVTAALTVVHVCTLLLQADPPRTKDGESGCKKAADAFFEPSLESLKRYKCPQWFRDAKFGIWAHWGPQAVPMVGDWYARQMYLQGHEHYAHHLKHYGHPSQVGYKDIIPLWKAEKWDPDRLMALYKKAGAAIS